MFKRSVAILATTACLGILVAPQAQAAPPSDLQSYAAGSNAAALLLTLLGKEVAVSATTAAVSSTPQPTAASDGAALLLAGTPVPGAAPSTDPGGAKSNQQCPGLVDLGTLTAGTLDGLSADIACVQTTADANSGSPAATSQTGEVGIDLQGLSGAALEPVLTPIVSALVDGLTQVEEQALCGGVLAPVCQVVNQVTQINVDDLVTELIGDIDQLDNPTFTVLQVAVAPTRSEAAASKADGVTAEAGSNAVTISLFPGLLSTIADLTGLGDPNTTDDALLTVRLGTSHASVVRDATTGKATTDASAAQLLGIDTSGNLGILGSILGDTVPQLTDALSQPLAALSCDGGALAALICIDLGSVHTMTAAELTANHLDYGKGTVGIEASAANISALSILSDALGGDVLGLQLAQANAAANATPVQPAAPTTAPPETPQNQPLPHTGGSNAFPLAMLLFGAATVTAFLVRRTRTV